jgi:hypothetical protein
MNINDEIFQAFEAGDFKYGLKLSNGFYTAEYFRNIIRDGIDALSDEDFLMCPYYFDSEECNIKTHLGSDFDSGSNCLYSCSEYTDEFLLISTEGMDDAADWFDTVREYLVQIRLSEILENAPEIVSIYIDADEIEAGEGFNFTVHNGEIEVERCEDGSYSILSYKGNCDCIFAFGDGPDVNFSNSGSEYPGHVEQYYDPYGSGVDCYSHEDVARMLGYTVSISCPDCEDYQVEYFKPQ